jgi:hypothetical protein
MSFFHVDGFLFWLLIGEFFAMLLKATFHRVKRWFAHVRDMTKRAGGTLLVDIEADYWAKKMKDPQYRSIWRWYFGNLWNKAHPQGTQVEKKKKRRLLKVLAFIAAILLICIGLIAAFGVPNIVPAPVPATTQLAVYGAANLSLVSHSTVGWVFDLNGTARADGNYSGGWAGLGMSIVRTDKSNADATVFFNVTSESFVNRTTSQEETYIYRATYLIFHEDTQQFEQQDIYSGGDTQFGWMFTVPAHGMIKFNFFLFFRAFNSTTYSRYVTMQPAFSGLDSMVGIDGGYNHGFGCYTTSRVGTLVSTRC